MKARSLVGLNLRRLRLAHSLSQEALGLAAACEPSYVGRIERGRENPTVDLLEAFAAVLEEPIGALFEPRPAGALLPPGMTPGRKPRPK
jgi:Helix-turn-helix.